MSDLTQANKEAFDAFAASYDLKSWQLKLSSLLRTSLQQNKDWLGAQWASPGEDRAVELLDYACGTGAASIALKSFVTHITGLDLSEGMIAKYNETMVKLGYSPNEVHGVVADLASSAHDQLPETTKQYDVAVISLALHHVDDSAAVLKALAKRLKRVTGVLVVVDFLPFKHAHKGHAHKMAETIKQHGFTKEQMAELYSSTGFENFGFIVVPERVSIGDDKHGGEDFRDMFIARGSRSV